MRTRLRYKFLKDRNDYNKREFSKQMNYCVSVVRKSKKLYNSNLMKKKLQIIKLFGRPLNRPYLINLYQEDEIIESDINTVQILNTFFYNIVNNHKIAQYASCDPISDNINYPVTKSIVKYRNHPSILKIGEVCNRKQCSLFFFFTYVDKEQILNKILSLDSAKAS